MQKAALKFCTANYGSYFEKEVKKSAKVTFGKTYARQKKFKYVSFAS